MEPPEELILGQRTWERNMEPILKDGFREGFEKGREESFQEGYDIGFKDGFNYAFEKGKECGKTKDMTAFREKYTIIKSECVICSNPEEKIMELDLSEIREKQKESQK